jgi:hypothetical protein
LATLVVLALACNMPSFTAGRTIVVTATSPPAMPSPLSLASRTEVPTETATPTATETPTPTPTVTLTPTPIRQMFTSTVDANCRWGPGTVYGIVGFVARGKTVPMGGRSADSSWWYVENPASPGTYCWVSATTGTVEGDVSVLPVIPAPPTPEPSPTLTPTVTPTVGMVIRIPTLIVVPLPIFRVTSASVRAPTTSYTGTCPYRMYWYGTITVNMAGTVKYEWETAMAGSFSGSGVRTLDFTDAGTRDTASNWVQTTVDVSYRARIHVTEPNNLYSNEVRVTVDCR